MIARALLPACALALVPSLATAGGSAAPGFRVYGPHNTTDTYMVDVDGVIVHTWPCSYEPGNGIYMLEDGSILRASRLPGAPAIGGSGGGVQRLAFDGTILWEFDYAGPDYWHHHDVEPMPNGNVLMIVWDRLTVADAIAAGRDPSIVSGTDWLPDSIVEIEPTGPTTGNVVWEWHVMDHLVQDFDNTKPNFGVVADHPELLDINYPPTNVGNGDWNHANSLDYDPGSDLIVLNFPFQDEYYLIDHSTTTAEAAGHTDGTHGKGGDFLYRWGNPAAYDRGTTGDQQLFNQHSTKFIAPGLPGAGNLLLFNNQYGSQFGEQSSAVFEIEIPASFSLAPGAAFGPAAPVWEYTAPVTTDLYSAGLSSAERLPNGNTLVVSGRQDGWMFEVTSTGTQVWEYFNQLPFPSALVFQASYYERMLWADRESLSTSAGDVVDFDMVAGTAYGGSFYLLAGTLSGTSPGIPFGAVNLPLNYDPYLLFTVTNAGGALPGTFGVLDVFGRGAAQIPFPSGVASPLAGLTMHHAFAVLDPGTLVVQRASNPVPLELLP